MPVELSEEEVFANDIDPLDAIREIRKEEGVDEEDLPPKSEEASSEEGSTLEIDGEDELDNLEEEEISEEGSKEEKTPEEEEQQEETAESEESEESEEEDNAEEKEEIVEAEKYKFKANGQEFEFTQEEILEQFEVVFGQAMDYTNKTKKMAPFRKMISAIESENINAEQLNLAIDALKGNKQAIQQILQLNEIDSFDLSENEGNDPYTPTEYGKDEVQLNIDEVTSVISQDPEYQITVDVVDRQWDDKSRDVLANNPGMIQGLHNDIKTGVYDKVAPVAMKMKVLDGNTKSDLEYYILAGEQVLSKQNSDTTSKQSVEEKNREAQDAEDKFDQESSEARRKRSATSTRKRADRKSVIDYLDDDDEKFDAWYDNLMASQ